MLNPLDALSVASAITQFISFGVDLTLQAKEVYKSARTGRGQTEAVKELKNRAEEFASTAESIVSQYASQNNGANGLKLPAQGADAKLKAAAAACYDTANELRNITDELSIDDGSSFVRAVRIAWRQGERKSDIARVEKRLEEQWSLLQTHLMLVLKDQQSTSPKMYFSFDEFDKGVGTFSAPLLHQDCERLLLLVDSVDYQLAGHVRDKLDALVRNGRNAQRRQILLQSLKFDSMQFRREQISEAHSSTYEWIFDRASCPSHRFAEWLERSSGIFWISGKAGCGKSTLMKFISTHQSTYNTLLKWAKDRELTVASYYFWNLGDGMEKSQKGLMQSLLYTVLQKSPELVDEVWNRLSSDIAGNIAEIPKTYWMLSELEKCFETVAQALLQGERKRCFCFFIDGLDEYEGESPFELNHYEHPGVKAVPNVIKRIRKLAALDHIKVCTSSRPWNPFVEGFKDVELSGYRLNLHEHTRSDIAKVVKDTLGPRIEDLCSAGNDQSNQMRAFVDEVVQKAEGVFLWVTLVTQDLMRGFTNRDSVEDLRRRLESIPAGLKEYFQHIFEKLDDFYRVKTARMFLLCVTALQPIPAILFSIFDREDLEDLVLKDKGNLEQNRNRLPSEALALENIERQINGHCLDLIEVRKIEFDISNKDEPRLAGVSFLHRTVREYMLEKEMASLLAERAGAKFDPLKVLMLGYLYLLKCSLSDEFFRHVENISVERLIWWAELLLLYAYIADVMQGRILMEILQEMDKALGLLAGLESVNVQQYHKGHWSNSYLSIGNRPIDRVHEEHGLRDFLAILIEYGLVRHVREMLSRDNSMVERKGGRPYLDYALREDRMPLATGRIPLIKLLLEKGCSPNAINHCECGCTVWELFLVSMTNVLNDIYPYDSELLEICEMLIENGAAEPRREVATANGHLLLDVSTIFNRICNVEKAEKLMAMMRQQSQIADLSTTKDIPLVPSTAFGRSLTRLGFYGYTS